LGANSETPLLDIKSWGVEDITLLEDYLRKYDVSNGKGKQIENIIKLIKQLQEPETTPVEDEPVTLADPQLEKLKERFNTTPCCKNCRLPTRGVDQCTQVSLRCGRTGSVR